MTEPQPPQKTDPSWIDRLAQQSTGLPKDEKKSPATPTPTLSTPWRFAGLGIQFAGTVGLFAWMGYKIDLWRGGKDNWVLLTLVLIAVLGNLYLLIKEAIKANK